MKRRIILVCILLAVLFLVGVVILLQREYAGEIYQGKHTRDWAWQLMSSQAPQAESNRVEATAALQALGPKAIPPLRRMLAERDKFYEAPLVKAARSLPTNERQRLLRQLRPGQAMANRLAAVSALKVMGTNALDAVSDLRRAMSDPVGQIRWDAAQALANLGDAGAQALVAAATDTNAAVRHAAVFMLGEFRTNAAAIVPTLLDAMLDPDQNVRTTATYSLGRWGQNADPVLMERLDSVDPAMRMAAMRAMAGIRPPLRRVTTNLIAIATNSSGELRRQAIETMGLLRVASTNAASIMIAALEDSDPAIRVSAIKAVGEISWRTAPAIPRLAEFTRSPSAAEREAAVLALAHFGPQASHLAPTITLLLNDPETSVRAAAADALRRIKPSAN